MKRVTEQSKLINAAIKSNDKKPTTRVFLEEEVLRMHSHKEMMMDWLFTEMEEHSKKLQMHSDWFDYFQRGLNVEKEFTQIMGATGIPQLADSSQFLQEKRRAQEAGSRSIRTGTAGAALRSQSASGQQQQRQ